MTQIPLCLLASLIGNWPQPTDPHSSHHSPFHFHKVARTECHQIFRRRLRGEKHLFTTKLIRLINSTTLNATENYISHAQYCGNRQLDGVCSRDHEPRKFFHTQEKERVRGKYFCPLLHMLRKIIFSFCIMSLVAATATEQAAVMLFW